ncbi:sodium/proton antiporter, CPA1 family [Frankineae bacterium MT45]|nr:sodium/proton antiporter, CPA1 family [Frankineae bacterium MT45]
MSVAAIAAFAAVVVLYVMGSEVLDRWHISPPMVFVAAGALLGLVLEHQPDHAMVRGLAELTLALVLFHDAAELQPRQLRSDAGVCSRLLLLALPLTIGAGFLLGAVMFPSIHAWFILLLGAALAPTDAGLGAATVLNPVVPVRVRRILNVESGLNDGLCTPIVLFALASAESAGPQQAFTTAARQILLGAVFGIAVGIAAGIALSWCSRSGYLQPVLLPIGALAVPVLCYCGAVAAGGNGFVAAFVAGTAFAAAAVHEKILHGTGDALHLTASVSTVLGYAVWSAFGVILVAHLDTFATWTGLGYALASLTVLRMLPVALVLLGTGFARPTRWFIGWFGPRGLASVIFGLIALEDHPDDPDVRRVVGTIALTVLLSVVLHGASAGVGAVRYGAWANRARPTAELGSAVTPVSGRGTKRNWQSSRQ